MVRGVPVLERLDEDRIVGAGGEPACGDGHRVDEYIPYSAIRLLIAFSESSGPCTVRLGHLEPSSLIPLRAPALGELLVELSNEQAFRAARDGTAVLRLIN